MDRDRPALRPPGERHLHAAPHPSQSRLPRLFAALLLALPVGYLALFFFYPLLAIFQVSLAPAGNLDLSGFTTLVERPYYRELLLFTFGQAALSTLLTLAGGLPAAYAFARYRFPGKTLLRAILTVPFVLPTVVVAMAFLALLGPRGLVASLAVALFQTESPLQLENSLTLILLAHVFYNLTVVVRVVGGFWANLDPSLEQAAATLGASPLRVFREITLPLLLPALTAAALLIFLFTFSSFGIILILGGPRFATLEIEIYRQTINFFNLPLAAALSLVQMLFTLTMMSLYTRLQARTALPLTLRAAGTIERRVQSWQRRLLLGMAVALPTLFVLLPLVALVARSLTADGAPSLHFYALLGENERRSVISQAPLLAIRNSFLFASVTMLLSLLLGTLGAYLLAPRVRSRTRRSIWRALLEPIFLLPLGTSAVTLGFGYLVALDEPPLNLRTSVGLIPLAHSLIAFPFVVRTLLPALRRISPALREAAATLGASRRRRLREVDLPLLWPALLTGAVFAFAISMGEFGATSLIQRPEWPTMPILIFEFLGRPGIENYGRALAMSVILMSTTLVGFIAIEQVRLADLGEF